MASVLLDTHILWWQADAGRLSKAQVQTLLDLERRGEPAAISDITLWEAALLAERGACASVGRWSDGWRR